MSNVAIITGASSGIGAASALELSKRGWSVVINYSKSAADANEVAAKCTDALVVAADARHVTGEAIFIDGGLHITPPR